MAGHDVAEILAICDDDDDDDDDNSMVPAKPVPGFDSCR
jgi:hypothetical protein